MGTLWINDGKIVIADGKIVVCDECPCDGDCYADVIAAIRERQAALDTPEWDEVPSPAKSLEDCILATNAIAASFISGTYSGGVSLPTMRTNSYATGATDFCVLYDLLCALQSTYVPFSATLTGEGKFKFVATQAIPLWQASVSDNKEFSALIPIAQSQWARVSYAGTSADYSRASLGQSGSTRSVYADLAIQKMRLVGFSSAVAKSARIFLKAEAYSTAYAYSGNGYHSLTENMHSLVESVNMGLSVDVDLSPWPCAEPPPWPPAMPSSGPWTGGYAIANGRFAVIDWSFAHT